MSYDLFMKPRNGSISENEFKSYFSQNPLYEIDMPQAWYNNEDTGVYFLFEFQTGTDDDGDGYSDYPVALNINYFRPTFFGLEAEPEVTRFINHFDMVVSDPQLEGMGEGEYNHDKFLSGWNHGNEFGYASILADPENRRNLITMPTEKLMQAWRWNYAKEDIQTELGESKFVPRVMFSLLNGKPVTIAVWPDGIPIAVPPADIFLVPRQELAPRRFFIRREDQTLLTGSEAFPIFEQYKSERNDDLLVLNYDTPPVEVSEFIRSLPTHNKELQGVAADSVLNKEIAVKYFTTT